MARLVMINEALWQLLREAGQMSEEHLTSRVAGLEEKYEKLGNRTVATCPKCNRPTSTKHVKCMYCGQEMPKGSVFDSLF